MPGTLPGGEPPVEIPRENARLVVTQANSLARSLQSFTLHQKRLLLLAMAVIRQTDEILRCVRIEISDYKRVFDLGANKGLYRELREAVEGLHGATLTLLYGRHGRSQRTISVVTTTDYVAGEDSATGRAYIDIELHESIGPYLLNLRSDFHSFPLPAIADLKSVSAIRLVELLLADAVGRPRCVLQYELELLQPLLGSAYERYTDFRRRVIEPSVAEINKLGFLSVTWEALKKGRAVSHVSFTVQTKRRPPNLEIVRDSTIHSLAAHLGFEGNINRTIRRHGADQVLTVIEEVHAQVNARKNTANEIKNPGAYLNQRLQALEIEQSPSPNTPEEPLASSPSLVSPDIEGHAADLVDRWREAQLEVINTAWAALDKDIQAEVEGVVDELLSGNPFANRPVRQATRRDVLLNRGYVTYPVDVESLRKFAESAQLNLGLSADHQRLILIKAEQIIAEK